MWSAEQVCVWMRTVSCLFDGTMHLSRGYMHAGFPTSRICNRRTKLCMFPTVQGSNLRQNTDISLGALLIRQRVCGPPGGSVRHLVSNGSQYEKSRPSSTRKTTDSSSRRRVVFSYYFKTTPCVGLLLLESSLLYFRRKLISLKLLRSRFWLVFSKLDKYFARPSARSPEGFDCR